MANFVSNDNATSLMNAINQKKDSKPTTITWAEWIALTDEQREGTHYIITNVPAKFSDKDAVFSIKDQTLTFTNKTATVTDSRITTDTYIFTFYHNQAVAQAAGIECSWTTGTVTFTVDENPSEDIVVDILCILPALATPPSEGGGHVIEDASGTDLPQQDTMQFADARVEDDATNGKTVVHVTQEPMTVSAFNAASDLDPGIYPLNGGEVLDDSMIMHDSTHTTRQAINELADEVTSVAQSLTWKYIARVTSHDATSIPTGAREIFCVGEFGNMSVMFPTMVGNARSGYYSSASDNGDIYVAYSDSNKQLVVSKYLINGSDVISQGVRVYYR